MVKVNPEHVWTIRVEIGKGLWDKYITEREWQEYPIEADLAEVGSDALMAVYEEAEVEIEVVSKSFEIMVKAYDAEDEPLDITENVKGIFLTLLKNWKKTRNKSY